MIPCRNGVVWGEVEDATTPIPVATMSETVYGDLDAAYDADHDCCRVCGETVCMAAGPCYFDCDHGRGTRRGGETFPTHAACAADSETA